MAASRCKKSPSKDSLCSACSNRPKIFLALLEACQAVLAPPPNQASTLNRQDQQGTSPLTKDAHGRCTAAALGQWDR